MHSAYIMYIPNSYVKRANMKHVAIYMIKKYMMTHTSSAKQLEQ